MNNSCSNLISLEVFTQPQYCVWLELGKQVRYPTGVQRAKTDSVDASNIARYAHQTRLCKPTSTLITQLKALTSLRNRLIWAVNALKQTFKKAKLKLLKKFASSINVLAEDLDAVNRQIESQIISDSAPNRIFYLVTSIVVISVVTATGFILTTQA